jgi:hypothetical protein
MVSPTRRGYNDDADGDDHNLATAAAADDNDDDVQMTT